MSNRKKPNPTVQNLTLQVEFYKSQNEKLLKILVEMIHILSVHEIQIIDKRDKEDKE